MNTNTPTDELNAEETTPETNVTVFGQREDAMEDFPVLKAFQQYIDAEQEKSRKRITIISVVFGVLVFAIILFFVIRLNEIGRRNQEIYDRLTQRNQELNDRLVEYAMSGRIHTQPVSESSEAIKTMTETITSLQKQLMEQQLATVNALKSDEPSKENLAAAKRNREDAEKLKKAIRLLKSEKQKIKSEKEKLRQAEIERQRRRLYPQYYAQKDAEAQARATTAATASRPPSPPGKSVVGDAIIEGIEELYEFDDENESDAIEYFKSDDDGNYRVPVKVNGDEIPWRIPE